MVDLRAWGALEGSSPADDEREHLSKGFLRRIGMVQHLILGQKSQKKIRKQVDEMAAIYRRMAYEPHITKQINHSNTQGTKYTQ
jgi:hypothetical protein